MPFHVAIMGQTGVGKTSLLNRIFGLNLTTSAVKPATTELDPPLEVPGTNGELIVHDLPGLGESKTTDTRYLRLYSERLLKADVAIWAVHADSRSVSLDHDALRNLLESVSKDDRRKIASKITVVLTKVDLLTPPPWIFYREGDGKGLFAPDPYLSKILEEKEKYFWERLVEPFADYIEAFTFNDTGLQLRAHGLAFDRFMVRYEGLMIPDTAGRLIRSELARDHPEVVPVIARLRDNNSVLPCSALFRYNLARVMTVLVNKLGVGAIGKFDQFTAASKLDRLDFSEAKQYRNIVVADAATRTVVIDLAAAG